jgi:hypothetical protein
VQAQVQLMSPILDDSLKQLPQSFDKTTPSPSVRSNSLSPNIANAPPVLGVNGPEDGRGDGVSESEPEPVQVEKPEDRSPAPHEPPYQPSPAPAPAESQPHISSSLPPDPTPTLDAELSQDSPGEPLSSSASEPAAPPTSSVTPPPQSETQNLADPTHTPPCPAELLAPPDTPAPELEFDIGKRGLATSIHAPKSSSTETVGPPLGPYPELPPAPAPTPASAPRNATHGRSRTLGRGPLFHAGAKRGGFLLGAESTQTGLGGDVKGLRHARAQSTPTSTTAASHRRQHSRPVITMDAMTRLAKTLGTALPKTEVATAATKLTASSE